jgi:hypothetical protein
MMSHFPQIKEYYSFLLNSNGEEYELIRVDDRISERFYHLVEKLEELPQVRMSTRGDSRTTSSKHDYFFNELLSKVFIVGTKSQSNMSEVYTEKYRHTDINREDTGDTLLEEVEQLVEEVNKEIRDKPTEHNIEGAINRKFINELSTYDMDSLNKWKVFFLSFLHNSGSLKEFKSISPFLSMAYGSKKYSIARKFALARTGHERGIIYLYALNLGDPYYIQTNLMTKKLNKFGITWYEDSHSEIMLMNGMYPHYMLGVFEVTWENTPRFIINPWLYDILINNKEFDYQNGLNINQENFNDLAKNLGYESFFFRNDSGDAFISDLNNEHIEKVIRP